MVSWETIITPPTTLGSTNLQPMANGYFVVRGGVAYKTDQSLGLCINFVGNKPAQATTSGGREEMIREKGSRV